MEGELGMRQQVGIPVAASWGSPGDVHLSRNMVEPYLDAAGLPGFPAPGGDVDHAALFQGVLYLLIHTSSPVATTACLGHPPHDRVRSLPAHGCDHLCTVPAGDHQEWPMQRHVAHYSKITGRAQAAKIPCHCLCCKEPVAGLKRTK